MQKLIYTKEVSQKKYLVCLPKDFECDDIKLPVVYVLGINDESELKKISDEVVQEKLLIAAIPCAEWEKYLTPWAAPSLKNRKPFEGCATDFLKEVEEIINPEIQKSFPVIDDCYRTAVVGYSLAGLTAVFSAFVCDFAANFGGVSASLWYPGWTDFCEKSDLKKSRNSFYLSVGDREHISKNKLMATVDEGFESTRKNLVNKGASVFFEKNIGGHFNDCEKRLAKGIDYLCSRMN